jgi:long-chain acyl-CoA synthetase
MMALEETFHTTLEESAVADAKTLGDLKTLIARGQVGLEPHADASAAAHEAGPQQQRDRDLGAGMKFPSYNRWRASWLLRRVSLPTWILPLARPFMQLDVRGLEHLAPLTGPVIFAANHESHMDGPAIFLSLPPRWRYNLAPAMAREFFHAHFHRREVGFMPWFTNSLNYLGATLGFNAFPLPQTGAGTRQTLRYIGEVVADGYSILIFPEGTRSPADTISRFRPGVAMIAARLDLPVIPVRLQGLAKVLDPHWRWPKRGPVKVTFGAPIRLSGEDYIAMAREVEAAVQDLAHP